MALDEDHKLFEQCRVCIVCSNDLPLETAEQVCTTPTEHTTRD